MIIDTDHSAIKYLMTKNTKPTLIQWVLLLQELNVKIVDCKGTENQVAYHLSHLKNGQIQYGLQAIKDNFPDEQLLIVGDKEPWYVGIVNDLTTQQ